MTEHDNPATASFRVEHPCTAPRELAYAIFADTPGWANWAPGVLAAVHVGEDDTNGVGTTRLLTMAMGFDLAEHIVAAEPGRSQRYVMDPLPDFCDYTADVVIEDSATDDGCVISWTVSFRPTPPQATEAILGRLRPALAAEAAALAQAAEKRHAG